MHEITVHNMYIIYEIPFIFKFNMMHHRIHNNTCVFMLFFLGGGGPMAYIGFKWTCTECLATLTGLHGTCSIPPKKDMHVSSISTISRTSIFPELSSSKRVKASSSNNWTSTIATQSQSRKSLTTYILMHCLCNISLDLEFPINLSIMANPEDLWCTIFPTSITSKAPKRKGSSAKPSIFRC